MNREKVISGKPPEVETLKLLEKGRDLYWGSIESLEESARDLLKSVTFVKGVYLAVLIFSELPEDVLASSALKVLLLSPVFLFLLSILFSTLTIISRRYEVIRQSPSHIEETIERIINYKARHLKLSLWFFVVSLGIVAMNVTVFYFR